MNLLHLMKTSISSHCQICDEPRWRWDKSDAYIIDADSYNQEDFARNYNLICCGNEWATNLDSVNQGEYP